MMKKQESVVRVFSDHIGAIFLIGFLTTCIIVALNIRIIPLFSNTVTPIEEEKEKETVKLVPYDGVVKNIFFHTLIAYPERSFDGDGYSNFFDRWYVTVKEFKEVLEKLYSSGYVLVNIQSIYSISQQNGNSIILKQPLMIPEGKKPLILSIDDVNYYPFTRGNGLIYKLVIDENDRIATLSLDPQGRTILRRDNEIIPILDTFIEKHPDFSHNGAKGIIGLTGFSGIFGYNTHKRNAREYPFEREQALSVVRNLKKNGWVFASHSYRHIHSARCTVDEFRYDTDRWNAEVRPLVGDTNIFIFPFGELFGMNSEKCAYLINNGFKLMMGVEDISKIYYNKSFVYLTRIPIDGNYFKGIYGGKDPFDRKEITTSERTWAQQ
ncbi:MAG: hypothetical protein GY754_17085 [bacterium]|nr:hypothetical protein [bacterium]